MGQLLECKGIAGSAASRKCPNSPRGLADSPSVRLQQDLQAHLREGRRKHAHLWGSGRLQLGWGGVEKCVGLPCLSLCEQDSAAGAEARLPPWSSLAQA